MKLAIAVTLLVVLGSCAGGPDTPVASPEPVALAVDDRSVARGAEYAQVRCASCHAVAEVGESPLAAAPRFRDLGQRYPVEQLAEAFAEGAVTAHPAMPEFILSPEENRDLIAYLKSIQVAAAGSNAGSARP